MFLRLPDLRRSQGPGDGDPGAAEGIAVLPRRHQCRRLCEEKQAQGKASLPDLRSNWVKEHRRSISIMSMRNLWRLHVSDILMLGILTSEHCKTLCAVGIFVHFLKVFKFFIRRRRQHSPLKTPQTILAPSPRWLSWRPPLNGGSSLLNPKEHHRKGFLLQNRLVVSF